MPAIHTCFKINHPGPDKGFVRFSVCKHSAVLIEKHFKTAYEGHDGCPVLTEKDIRSIKEQHDETCEYGDKCLFEWSSSGKVCQRCHFNGVTREIDTSSKETHCAIQQYDEGKYNLLCSDCSHITKGAYPIIVYKGHKNPTKQIWYDTTCGCCSSKMMRHPGLATSHNKFICIECLSD